MRLPKFSKRDRLVAAVSLALAVGLVAVVAILTLAVGVVDVGADRPHAFLTYELLHAAFGRSVAARTGSIAVPADIDMPSRVALGAQHYELVCSNCHGAPGLGQSPVALSMTPTPQSLPAVVGQFTDAQLFWIVKHGVKFSAMPSWTVQTRDDEIWSLVAFLRKLPGMTAADYLAATRPAEQKPAQKTVAPIAIGDAVTAREAPTRVGLYPADEHLQTVPALAFGDRSALADALVTCSRCHGADGTGSVTGGEAPNLTLQNADYLEAALRAYADGRRVSGFMRPVASALSDGQVMALAAHFVGLGPRSETTPSAAPDLVEAGLRIAGEGIAGDAVPACAFCHEGRGRAITGAPNLAGQSEVYLRRQLQAMRGEDRGSTRAWNPMSAVAARLTANGVSAVAAYYASLAPGAPPPTRPAAPTLPDVAAEGAKQFAAICSKCHQAEGTGGEDGAVPNLTLASADYVAMTLSDFRVGHRENERMHLVAAELDATRISELSAYVGRLPPKSTPGRTSHEAATRGAAIAQNGIADRGVPACLGCHGATGPAAIPLIARLDGQNAQYLERRLASFAALQPSAGDALNPMPMFARRLTDGERADLASFFALRTPLPKAIPGNEQ